MTTPAGEPMVMRIPESGQIAGDENNPPLVGGTANPPDGSIQIGRTWLYNGTGTSGVNVPGSSAAGDITGMGALQVDMRTGYNYDVQVDLDVFGTLTTSVGDYEVFVDGSDDGGSTWAYPGLLRNLASTDRYKNNFTENTSSNTMRARGRNLNVGLVPAGGAPINTLRVQLKRIDANADAAMRYCGQNCILQVTEYK